MSAKSVAGGILLAIAIIFVLLVVAALIQITYENTGKMSQPGGYKTMAKAPFELDFKNGGVTVKSD